jgi:transcriptional regulator with XRE-family HTH domain
MIDELAGHMLNSADTTSLERGTSLIRSGALTLLREQLGISATAMAALLYVSPTTFLRWEKDSVNGIDRRIWTRTAERVDRFFTAAIRQLELAQEHGYDMKNLVPFHLISSHLSIPSEVLFNRYRKGEIEGVDLGVLGLWMTSQDFEALINARSA